VAPVALVLAAGPAHAQPSSPGKQPAARASAQQSLSEDDALLEARRAFVRGATDRFEAMAGRVSPEHPLAKYIDFWRLRLALQRQSRAEVPMVDATDRMIRGFLAAHENTVVADLMRRDWLLELGKRRAWERFDAEYSRWVLRDSDSVHCLHWLGRIERRLPAEGASAAIDAPRHLDEACGDLLAAMQAAGLADDRRLHVRMLAALEAD